MTDSYLSMAQAVGFLDGEGHVAISKAGDVRVEAEQTEPAPLFMLQKVFGGTVNLRGTRDSWRWRLCKKENVRYCLIALEESSWGRKKIEAGVALLLLDDAIKADVARDQIHRIRERRIQ